MNNDGTQTHDGVTMTYAEAINWAKAEARRADLLQRQIAAAPEMLEALQVMWKQHHCWTKEEKRDAEVCDVCDAARAAIAKATGGDL